MKDLVCEKGMNQCERMAQHAYNIQLATYPGGMRAALDPPASPLQRPYPVPLEPMICCEHTMKTVVKDAASTPLTSLFGASTTGSLNPTGWTEGGPPPKIGSFLETESGQGGLRGEPRESQSSIDWSNGLPETWIPPGWERRHT